MPRRKPTISEPAAIREPIVIQPNAVYRLAELPELLGLRRSTASREIRAGRLRASKRAGKIFTLGEWVLSWLPGGEIMRNRKGGQDQADSGCNGEGAVIGLAFLGDSSHEDPFRQTDENALKSPC